MKYKKRSNLIKVIVLLLIIFILFGFQNRSNEDNIKVTEISLFGHNYLIYFSKIYLAYAILIDHYFDCNWSMESKNLIDSIDIETQQIDYSIVQNEKELVQILYKGPYARDTFFFNSTIFNSFAIEKKFSIPVKNSFDLLILEQAYDLLIKFYNKNKILISKIAEKMVDSLSKYFIKYSELITEKSSLLILDFDKISALVFFYETSMIEKGACSFSSIYFTIHDDLLLNCQIILHETIHIWHNYYNISNKIVDYPYKKALIDYLKIFVDKYDYHKINALYLKNEKEIITYVLTTSYVNFDEFFAYEYSKYLCEKSFNNYKGLSFAEMNSSFLSKNTNEDLKKLSNSLFLKSILSANDDAFYIKAFILYLLCMTIGYDYSVNYYSDYI